MGPQQTRCWAVVLVALLALVSVASFVHTDDGCQVEIHCLACRLALGVRGGTAVVAVRVGPQLSDSDPLLAYRQPSRVAPADRPQPSRGPPLT